MIWLSATGFNDNFKTSILERSTVMALATDQPMSKREIATRPMRYVESLGRSVANIVKTAPMKK
jgi:hypothetical protein